MSPPRFRITVRGFFDELTEPQRRELLAEAGQHDVLEASYTATGHLSYDLSAREAFVFRFLDSGEDDVRVIDATERAEAAAVTWLTDRGYGFKNLRTRAFDPAEAPLSKRQRRAAARG